MTRHHRLLAGATLAALVATSLAGVATPTQAVVATQNVTFEDCDLTVDGEEAGGPVSFATPLTLDYPSPVAAGSSQTVSLTLGSLPAGTFPDDLPGDASIEVLVGFEDQNFSVTEVLERKDLSSFDADASYDIGELEQEKTIFSSGFYDLKPKYIQINLFGIRDEGTFDFISYDLVCDQVVNPSRLLTVAAFDPQAAAGISVTEFSARQGGRTAISGVDFAHEPTDDPDLDVAVSVGGVPAGSFDVDETGAFSGVLRIPDFVKPGDQVTVRATSQGESATTTIDIRAVKGKVTVSPKTVKPGKKATVKASGFKPGETVKISLKGGKGKGKRSYATKAKVNGSGVATKAIKLRKAAKGSWKVTVVGPQSFRKGSTGFKVG